MSDVKIKVRRTLTGTMANLAKEIASTEALLERSMNAKVTSTSPGVYTVVGTDFDPNRVASPRLNIARFKVIVAFELEPEEE